MSLGTLFVPASSRETFEASLSTAKMLADQFQSHIMASHVTAPIDATPPALVFPLEGAYWADLKAESERVIEKARSETRECFKNFCQSHHIRAIPSQSIPERGEITASLHENSGPLPYAVSYHARQSDLVVLSGQHTNLNYVETELREDLLFSTATPVLMTKDPMLALPQRIMVGWNGSLEATQALKAARPFLDRCQTVTLVTIGSVEKYRPTADDMAAYLRRNGIAAESRINPDVRTPVEDQLIADIDALNADMLVMGAYSHSRLREVILGGVTRSFIEEPPIPLLSAH